MEFPLTSSIMETEPNCHSTLSATSRLEEMPIEEISHILADGQEIFEDPELAEPMAADETSVIASVDEAQSEQASELLIEIMKIQGDVFYSCTICGHKSKRERGLKTHFLVHTDHRPFECPAEDCEYRAKSLHYLRRHSRRVHHINDLPARQQGQTPSGNLRLNTDFDNHAEVDVNSSANFSLAFACMLCEFVGDSHLAAFAHAQQHKTSSCLTDFVT